MNKTTKIGHTIEASNLIKIFKPDIITNISSSLGPSPFWRKKISLEQLENISFKIPKNLDDKNKEFIYENYNTCLLFEKQDSLSTSDNIRKGAFLLIRKQFYQKYFSKK